MPPTWPRLFELLDTRSAIRNDPLKGLGQKIFDLCPPPARLLEVGCGSGLLSGYLADFGYQVVATDKDPAVLAYAKKRLMEEMLGMPLLLERDALLLESTMAEYAPFDCAFSQGLLEHFSDYSIESALHEQLAVANLVIFSVPSEKYPRLEFGDERHLPLAHWYGLMSKFEKEAELTLAEYGNGLHLLGILKRREPL